MAEIRKLKKQLLREERQKRRNSSPRPRLLRRLILGLLLLAVALASVYWVSRERILDYRFARAEALLDRGETAAAAAAFQRFQANHPRQRLAPEALFRAGEILHLYEQKQQEALLVYLLVIRDYPQSRWAHEARVQAADIYKNRLSDYNQAISLLQKIADSDFPGAASVQYEIADCYFRLNNFEQARIEFEGLQKAFPDSPLLPEVQFRIGMTLALERNFPAAIAALQKVVELWPGNRYAIEARFQLAALYVEQELLQKALELLVGLRGQYPEPIALEKRIERVEERIRKKRKAG